MADLVERIRKNLPDGCLRKGKLTKEGCSVSLKDAPRPSIVIDMDSKQAPVRKNETKCDYIFIGGSGNAFLMPLELTGSDLDVSKVVRQLQAGADISDDCIIPKREQVQFLPVGVYGGRFPPAQKRRFLRSTSNIRFKGKPFKIELLNCGDPLIKALRKRR